MGEKRLIELVKPLPADPAMILFFDPGQTTGFAYLTDGGSFHSGEETFQSLCTQYEITASTFETALWVGWEDFIITTHTYKMHGSSWALETIGAIRYLSQKYDCRILGAAPPSARSLGSLQKLKDIGWYRPGKGHANDAASHLLAWLIREHKMPAEILAQVLGKSAPELTPCEATDGQL